MRLATPHIFTIRMATSCLAISTVHATADIIKARSVNAFAQLRVMIKSILSRQTRHIPLKHARLAELAPPLKPVGLAIPDM